MHKEMVRVAQRNGTCWGLFVASSQVQSSVLTENVKYANVEDFCLGKGAKDRRRFSLKIIKKTAFGRELGLRKGQVKSILAIYIIR